MSYVEVNGARFFVKQTGKGRPLILVSGYSSDHAAWTAVVPALSKHFKVITFDNRGVGQTQDDGKSLSAELMADDVIAIANKLGLEKPHVAGLSMGGNIAQMVGIKHSDKIGKLVCLATTAKWRKSVIHGIQGMIEMGKDECGTEAILNIVLGWIHGEKFLSNPDNIEYIRQIFLNNPNPQSIENQARQFGALKRFDTTDQLHKITAPTLIGYGVEDMLSFKHESEALANIIPNAQLEAFDCAHVIMVEEPEALSESLINFLK